LEDRTGRRADGVRHRLARLDRKINKKRGLFDLRNVEP
jgi:hypothetical protein